MAIELMRCTIAVARAFVENASRRAGNCEFSIELAASPGYLSPMRRSFIWLLLLSGLMVAWSAPAATGRVIKVLPQFLDLKGRDSTYPSLYERDAYQAYLRQHTNEVSGVKFHIQWKTKGKPTGPVKLRVEIRGVVRREAPEALELEKAVEPGGWFNHWSAISVTKENYRTLGEVTAWRVTLWEDQHLLGEQRSFLW
jgi:hypothetical protein